jgi:hypothetical protein
MGNIRKPFGRYTKDKESQITSHTHTHKENIWITNEDIKRGVRRVGCSSVVQQCLVCMGGGREREREEQPEIN